MPKKPTQKNTLPRPLQDLSAREMFILTHIPLHLLEGFIEGRFKPSKSDHKKIASTAVSFYTFTNTYERDQFIQRKKYRAIKHFLSKEDKESLYCRPENYAKEIDALVDKHWDKIVRSAEER